MQERIEDIDSSRYRMKKISFYIYHKIWQLEMCIKYKLMNNDIN